MFRIIITPRIFLFCWTTLTGLSLKCSHVVFLWCRQELNVYELRGQSTGLKGWNSISVQACCE